MTEDAINFIINGNTSNMPDAVKKRLNLSVQMLNADLEKARHNRTTSDILDGKSGKTSTKSTTYNPSSDSEMFTTISEMINGNSKDFAGFGTLLDNLYAKNKKYFSIIKDYEIMPILIPQINRVLGFLVNECLSPDVQNSTTFTIKYTGESDDASIQSDIDAIKKEMKLDNLLREVYTNRYKLGREYYIVEDYNTTFDRMLDQIRKKRLNEDTAGVSDYEYLGRLYGKLAGTISEVTVAVPVQIVKPSRAPAQSVMFGLSSTKGDVETNIVETTMDVTMKDLNIVVERSPVAEMIADTQAELLAESYSVYSSENFFKAANDLLYMNEDAMFTPQNAPVDMTKLEQLVTSIRNKKLQRCTIRRFDPAKLFKLKVGGKVIGYFYVTDINEGVSSMVNFAQSLKDQLMKTRATNLSAATQTAEEVISKELATRIIATFDPNLDINRVEDIDLMHDFIRNTELYKGNKRITFYYADEIFDMSRADDSILTNAVFFTKLYATLLLNNIVTKVLRGRGRQIHTVRMGASPNVKRYLDNAMASLAMPEHNLGTLHGSFEQIMNPFNGASDIVIPTEEDDQQYIRTDYIPGQDVDMNDDFLRTLLNAIITSFGLDAAVLDATNGNLQFARTLTMESLQICTSIRNEQQDLHDAWTNMCLKVLRIMGTDATRAALDNGQIEVSFYEPKSLIIQNTIDDINNVKSLAENIADIIPEFNEEDSEQRRAAFIYQFVKSRTNLDFADIEKMVKETMYMVLDSKMDAEISATIRNLKDSTKEVQYGDATGDGLPDGMSGAELSDEERAIMDTPMGDDEY